MTFSPKTQKFSRFFGAKDPENGELRAQKTYDTTSFALAEMVCIQVVFCRSSPEWSHEIHKHFEILTLLKFKLVLFADL